MKNQYWRTTTVTRTTSVVPTHGFGMGDVCPMAVIALATSAKRHADAAKANPATGFLPWSPPVT